jgi:hypothetical protein
MNNVSSSQTYSIQHNTSIPVADRPNAGPINQQDQDQNLQSRICNIARFINSQLWSDTNLCLSQFGALAIMGAGALLSKNEDKSVSRIGYFIVASSAVLVIAYTTIRIARRHFIREES